MTSNLFGQSLGIKDISKGGLANTPQKIAERNLENALDEFKFIKTEGEGFFVNLASNIESLRYMNMVMLAATLKVMAIFSIVNMDKLIDFMEPERGESALLTDHRVGKLTEYILERYERRVQKMEGAGRDRYLEAEINQTYVRYMVSVLREKERFDVVRRYSGYRNLFM